MVCQSLCDFVDFFLTLARTLKQSKLMLMMVKQRVLKIVLFGVRAFTIHGGKNEQHI